MPKHKILIEGKAEEICIILDFSEQITTNREVDKMSQIGSNDLFSLLTD